MGALSHFIERAGVATTSVSLIREHTVGMHVPRSIAVPFPFGRPLGFADDPKMQTDILRMCLRLLESASEPTVIDYPYDGPITNPTGEWACALTLPEPELTDDTERLMQALLDEVRALAPWYDEAFRARGRTSVGASGLSADHIEQMASELAAFAAGGDPTPDSEDGPAWAHPLPVRLKFIADDLRAFYHEAISAQPGNPPASDVDLNTWVFGRTQLGEVIRRAADRIQNTGDRRTAALVIGLIPAGFRSESRRTWS